MAQATGQGPQDGFVGETRDAVSGTRLDHEDASKK